MTSAYTPLLGLVLPVTGELSGTWGTVWNDSGTSLIDSAISGTTTLSADADVTLTTTTGAANQARQAIILWTAGGTVTRTITVPAQSKIYTVINKTSSTQSIKIVGAGPTTGVTIIAGESAVVAWNGVDFIKISNISGAGVFSSITNTGLTSGRVVYSTTGGLETDSANLTFNGTTLTANTLNLTNQLTTAYGGTGLTSYTAGDLPYYATGTALSKLGIGTNGQILTSSGTAPQWSTLSGVAVTTFSAGTTGLTPNSATSGAVTLAGTLATTNGGTGLTSFTANGVVYASSTSALATGSALTFDGTNFATTGTITSGGSYNFNTTSGRDILWGTGSYTYITGNPGTGVMAFGIANAEQMRLTSTGLGIGTSSVGYKLQVSSGATAAATYFASTATPAYNATAYNGANALLSLISGGASGAIDGIRMSQGGASEALFGLVQEAGGAGAFVWQGYNGSAYAERMRLDSSGNLGIGTSSPAEKLEVYGSTVGGVVAKINNANASGYSQIYLTNSGASGRSYVLASGGNSSASGFANNFYIYDTAAAATRLTLDSSGNLGLGVTPSATTIPVIQSTYGMFSGNTQTNILQNAVFNSGYKYVSSNYATQYQQNGGTHAWYTAPSGTAGSAISFTQAMTLTAGGNLLIGTTTSATSGSSNIVSAYATGGGVQIAHTNSGGGGLQVALAGGGIATYTYTGAVGSESYTERARIDSSGNLLVGTTSGITSGGVVIQPVSGQSTVYIGHITGTGSGASYEEYYYAGTKIGSITQSGTTAVLYNITSDQRLKENIVDAPEFGSVIDAIQVRSYDWKADGNHQRAGFIAQELVAVAPEAVHQPADPEQMMAVDYSKLVPMLVKEIQSLRQRLAALEAA